MAQLVHLIKISLVVSWLDLVVCFTPTVHFGKAARIGELVSVWGISFQRCIDDCLARKRCNALLYNRQFKQCMLGSKVIAASDVMDKSGLVLVTGFDEYHRTAHVCGDRACELTETCVEKGSGVRQCEVTECGPPKNASYNRQFLGNVYTVGSKLKVAEQSGPITTCSPSGIWTVEKTGTERIMTGTDDCLSTTNVVPLPYDNMVLCDVTTEGGNWLIFQRRFDGSVDFYRSWNDYVNGFGHVTGEFWLGLDKLSSIIADAIPKRFELRVDMEHFNGTKYFAKYSTFNVSDGSDKYRLGVGNYSGNAGDSFSDINGMRFSTHDNDNDMKNDDNCAMGLKGAYWYKECAPSNLNGLYQGAGNNTEFYAKVVFWFTLTGHFQSLKTTEMKIRKVTV